MVESELLLLLLLLLYQTRNVDVHFEVDGVVTYESSVEQLVQLHELGKPCRHQTQTGHPICSYAAFRQPFSAICHRTCSEWCNVMSVRR